MNAMCHWHFPMIQIVGIFKNELINRQNRKSSQVDERDKSCSHDLIEKRNFSSRARVRKWLFSRFFLVSSVQLLLQELAKKNLLEPQMDETRNNDIQSFVSLKHPSQLRYTESNVRQMALLAVTRIDQVIFTLSTSQYLLHMFFSTALVLD